jgi:hypothetical protein
VFWRDVNKMQALISQRMRLKTKQRQKVLPKWQREQDMRSLASRITLFGILIHRRKEATHRSLLQQSGRLPWFHMHTARIE